MKIKFKEKKKQKKGIYNGWREKKGGKGLDYLGDTLGNGRAAQVVSKNSLVSDKNSFFLTQFYFNFI